MNDEIMDKFVGISKCFSSIHNCTAIVSQKGPQSLLLATIASDTQIVAHNDR